MFCNLRVIRTYLTNVKEVIDPRVGIGRSAQISIEAMRIVLLFGYSALSLHWHELADPSQDVSSYLLSHANPSRLHHSCSVGASSERVSGQCLMVTRCRRFLPNLGIYFPRSRERFDS
jgi:hypothetical protein